MRTSDANLVERPRTSLTSIRDWLDSDQDQRQLENNQPYPACFLELYEVSEGGDLGLGLANFGKALLMIGRRFLPSDANDPYILRFYRNLHLKDLALAQACSLGSPIAWERFLSRYRERLYSAALVIAKNDLVARELSESLYGDIFVGREGTNGFPSSKLASYSGRGSLEGWLKAVLAHTYVDGYRSQRRVSSLDQHLAAIGNACLSQPAAQDDRTVQYGKGPDINARLYLAIQEACAERTPEQRFLLAVHFFDGWSLAEIADKLGVHESTVSRRMNRTLREMRKSITRKLRIGGMNSRQIEQSLQFDVQDLPFEIRGTLLRGSNLVRE